VSGKERIVLDFTKDVFPVVKRWVELRLKGEELQSLALVLAWWLWRSAADRGLPASVFARTAVLHALAGRDLPGVREGCTDVFDKLTQWQGGGMGETKERGPGALEQVAWREEALAIYATLTDGERELWDAVESGVYSTGEIARRMEVSAARVSQLRRQIQEKARR
jgi:hypothetical protein